MSVWCCVIDHNNALLGTQFEMEFDSTLNISKLTTRVVGLGGEFLKGVGPLDITVYHSSKIHADLNDEDLITVLSELDLSQPRVHPNRLATGVASGTELLIFKKCAPQNQASSKRSLPSSALNSHSERLKRTRLALEAPSTMAVPSQYTRIQADPDLQIFDDRPKPDPRIAPIALLYPFYGEFHDIYAGRPLPDDMQPENTPCEMEKKVRAFAAAMSRKYVDDFERREVGNKLLNAIFAFEVRPGDIGKARSDGHSLVAGVVGSVAEWKNELVGISALPDVQCVGYVTRTHTYLDALKGKGDVRRIPALGIVLIGDLIQFNAIILLGHQYRSIGLTSPISCTLSATNHFEWQQLYRAFIAAHILQRRIHPDLESYLREPPESSPPAFTLCEYFFPAVTKLREDGRDATNKNHIQFKILDYHAGSDQGLYQHRHLYRARVTQSGHEYDSKDILVKFSESYSIDLHNFCHEQGHAPRVLGYERLPGGWFAIAMEYLADTKSIDSGLTPNRRGELEGLVTQFHIQDLVHGDLRSANILCNNDNFWLIDFDWGGKAGEVMYPTWLLHEELLSGRQLKDLTIRKEDDLRILRATLENLKPVV